MSTSPDPYQSPTTVAMHPSAVQWLAVPSVSLARVARGLGIMYTGIVLILLGFALLVVSPFLSIPQDAKLLALQIATALVIGGAVMEIVGPVLCLATPQETGAAGYIYVSVAALIGNLALQAAALLQAMEKISPLPPALGIVQPILGVMSGLTFMLFLQRLNKFIGRPDLARKAMTVFVVALALIMIQAGFLTYVLVTPMVPIDARTLGWASLAVVIAWLVTFLMYANLLTYTRKAILRGSAAS
jgi:hypothetical protein